METIDDRTANDGTEQQTASGDEDQGDGRRSRWRSPLLWAGIALAAVVVAAGAFWLAAVTGGDDQASEETAGNTATIRATDLVVTETLDGTLGFGEGDPIVAKASQDAETIGSGLNGTLTATAAEGIIVEQGGVIYEVDRQPVAVLYGDFPAYRPLSTRSEDGPDVAQLEAALVALGFDPDGEIVVDEEFTSATAAAVEAWQEAIGAEVDGVVAQGEIVFTEGPVYVDEVLASVGGSVGPGTPIIATSSSPTGTITSIVDDGAIVDHGDVLYEVEGRPVVLLAGTLPAYRTMRQGTSGDDVAQLEQVLADLGFGGDGLVVDGVFDAATAGAVAAWQSAIGAPPDRVVDLGEAVFSPGSLRIGSVDRAVGDSVQDGVTVMTTSAATTFVAVELSAGDQGLLAVGDAVTVELPDGTQTRAVVTEVGTVARAGQEGGAPYFDVTIVLEDPAAATGLDEAPVEVAVVTDSAEGVLAVPVTALLALAEGGYAVEVVAEDGSTYLVGAEPGLFADGFVEVTGDGLEAGMAVVIP
ncbi:MAG: hypothetical protein EHM57_01255 [Actinobacteria bacterium]|nr:MAG: hypothetical protein EHM57_01255 [Actinomycetota bacterium]